MAGQKKLAATDQRVILDVNDAKQNRVVDIWDAFASTAHRRPQQWSSVMELDPIHFRTDDLGQAVVSGWSWIESAQSEARNPFVDLLRNERDVEEKLRKASQ